MNTPRPQNIRLHRQSKTLTLHYNDANYTLPAEYLRVHSPSAEVQGHGGQGAVLQTGKRQVAISKIEAAGNYGLKITFDDGHDTGIYTWPYLYQLVVEMDERWAAYLKQISEAGLSREAFIFKG